MKHLLSRTAILLIATFAMSACGRSSSPTRGDSGFEVWTTLNSSPHDSASHEAKVVAFMRCHGPLFQASTDGLSSCDEIIVPTGEKLEYFRLPQLYKVMDGYHYTIVVSRKEWKYWIVRRGGFDGLHHSIFGPESISRYLPNPTDSK